MGLRPRPIVPAANHAAQTVDEERFRSGWADIRRQTVGPAPGPDCHIDSCLLLPGFQQRLHTERPDRHREGSSPSPQAAAALGERPTQPWFRQGSHGRFRRFKHHRRRTGRCLRCADACGLPRPQRGLLCLPKEHGNHRRNDDCRVFRPPNRCRRGGCGSQRVQPMAIHLR